MKDRSGHNGYQVPIYSAIDVANAEWSGGNSFRSSAWIGLCTRSQVTNPDLQLDDSALSPFCFDANSFAQDVQFDYDRSANFKRLQDVAVGRLQAGATRRQGSSAGRERRDLYVGYQASISEEKQFDSFGGWGWPV
jgi:hypothetical protein